MRAEGHDALTVRAPGRLHLGFLDPAGSLGRRFGSVGLVIEGYETAIEFSPAPRDEVEAVGEHARAEIDRVAACLHALRQHSGRVEPLRLRLLRALPAHAGFGSGTQLALAVGRGFTQWHGLDVSTATLARWLGRGLRSGVGIAGFDQGGLLVDGGPGADGSPAPLLARLELPERWRVVVVEDPGHRGLSGTAERQALAALAPLPQAAAAEICHQVLMRVLPGAASGDFPLFAAGVTRMQQILGGHFAPVQGGTGYTSHAVGRLVDWLGEASLDPARGGDAAAPGAATGQSSWGPTGFAIVSSQTAAQRLLDAARAAGVMPAGLLARIVAPRHRGATLAWHRLDHAPLADSASHCH
ncbi:beta-ribofuranosylaminobenzene 5'-phosphate synthase family protein [Ideonella sp. YS5]|uniref:beta-ribofuranosylaminobenzene 5'-phosphate synthase family protein n=1 Tax=Ideonella sp. YS5 TaxID=3453714 RepID=UPI003EE908B3